MELAERQEIFFSKWGWLMKWESGESGQKGEDGSRGRGVRGGGGFLKKREICESFIQWEMIVVTNHSVLIIVTASKPD